MNWNPLPRTRPCLYHISIPPQSYAPSQSPSSQSWRQASTKRQHCKSYFSSVLHLQIPLKGSPWMCNYLLMRYVDILNWVKITFLQVWQDFCWAVDVYIHEYLDWDALFTLRANREEVSKVDSNDDLLVWIIDLLCSKPLLNRQSSTSLQFSEFD